MYLKMFELNSSIHEIFPTQGEYTYLDAKELNLIVQHSHRPRRHSHSINTFLYFSKYKEFKGCFPDVMFISNVIF